MIGAWDADRGAQPFSADEMRKLTDALDADANAGHIFVVHTGGDGSGPVDLYVDEPIPDDAMATLTPIGERLVLAVPSGRLMVDGVEYYRSKKPGAVRPDKAVIVRPGEYLLRCYAAKDDEGEGREPPEAATEQVVGSEDLRYYDRVTRTGCLTGILLLFLFPLLAPFVGPKIAIATTIVVFVGFFSVRERVLRRNPRFAQLRERITAHRLQTQSPTFVLHLESSS